MAGYPVRIGIMSFAHMHAFSYGSCLKELPQIEFVGVADDDQARAKTAGRRLGVKVFENYEAMLASDIDAVIVCSENINHRRHVVVAAQAEKHAMCEKPLATTKEDAEAIVEVCRRSSVKLMTAFPCRFHPAYRELKAKADAGELGKLLAVEATNQGMCPGGWFTDTKLAGGGAVMDHTVHVLDLLRNLLKAEATRVYAEIDNRRLKGEFDDTGIISIDFSNRAFATIDASWSRPKGSPFWGNLTMNLTGTKGVAEMDMFAQKADLISEKAGRLTYEYWGDNADRELVASFARCIAEDRPPEVTGEDGAKAVEVVAAAYLSARTGEPVELED